MLLKFGMSREFDFSSAMSVIKGEKYLCEIEFRLGKSLVPLIMIFPRHDVQEHIEENRFKT